MTLTHYTKGCANAVLLLNHYRAFNANNGAIVDLLSHAKRHVEKVMSRDLRKEDAPTPVKTTKKGK